MIKNVLMGVIEQKTPEWVVGYLAPQYSSDSFNVKVTIQDSTLTNAFKSNNLLTNSVGEIRYSLGNESTLESVYKAYKVQDELSINYELGISELLQVNEPKYSHYSEIGNISYDIKESKLELGLIRLEEVYDFGLSFNLHNKSTLGE